MSVIGMNQNNHIKTFIKDGSIWTTPDLGIIPLSYFTPPHESVLLK